MKIQTDSCYLIGDEHKECQDYALTGVYEKYAYAIVADGCSACRSVDFGARILAHSVETFIPMIAGLTNNLQKVVPNSLGMSIISDAQRALGLFPRIDKTALCSTLMIAITDGKLLHVYCYGDGMVYFKWRGESTYNAEWLTYNSGAPYYLFYKLNPTDQKLYQESFTDKFRNIVIHGDIAHDDGKGKIVDSVDIDMLSPYSHILTIEDGDNFLECIGLSSDGIGSFQAQKEGQPYSNVPAWEMIPEFFGYKNYAGDFVQRRMQAMEKTRRKLGMKHHDDVSCAAIHFSI